MVTNYMEECLLYLKLCHYFKILFIFFLFTLSKCASTHCNKTHILNYIKQNNYEKDTRYQTKTTDN